MKAILVEGCNVLEEREIEDLSQLEELNRQAKEATDCNLHWVVREANTMIELLIKRIDGSIEWVKVGEGMTLGLIANSYGKGTELLAVKM
jgi:hypothetical protein